MTASLLGQLVRFIGLLVATALLLWLLIDVLAGSGSSGPGFLGGVFTGGFGRSASQNAEIGTLIGERLTVTLPLALLAFVVAGMVGIGLGVASRSMPVRALSALLSALPAYWLGVLLILGLAAGLRLLPAGGFVPWGGNPGGALASLVLPALAVGLPHGGQLAVVLGSSFAAVSPAQVLRARAEGATLGQAWWRLGLAGAGPLLPALLGRTFASILVGTVLVESMFYLPGLGRLALGATLEHDLPLLEGSLFVLIALALLGMALLNLARLGLDPGLRRAA